MRRAEGSAQEPDEHSVCATGSPDPTKARPSAFSLASPVPEQGPAQGQGGGGAVLWITLKQRIPKKRDES